MAERKVPVIDLTNWFQGDDAQRETVAREIGAAAKYVGFFTIVNHNIGESLIQDAFRVSRDFFDKELDDKLKVEMSEEYPYGYEHCEVLAASLNEDTEEEQKKSPDWKETFNVNCNRGQVRWPEDVPEFKEVLENYYANLAALAAQIMRMFAIALELPEDFFENKIDQHNSALRTLNYPHQDQPPVEGQLRASEHTDYGSITILKVGGPGLQVVNMDGSWQDVVAPDDAYVVNLGDLMSRWTNDAWKSTMHRVVNPPVNGDVENTRRQSIAFFHNPNEDAVIECIESCQSAENPEKYPVITAGEHLWSKHYKAVNMADAKESN